MNAVLKAGAVPAAEQSRPLRSTPSASVPLHAQRPGRWISKADLDAMLADAFDQGARNGQKQAEQRILESARRDAEASARQALQKALSDHQADVQKAQTAKWHGLAAQWATQLRSLRTEVDAEVTEWTFVATTRLLGRMSETQVKAAVRHVLSDAGLRDPVQVLVHPDDHQFLCAEPLDEFADVQFVPDATVALGGCLIRTQQQTLDARLEVQLQFLRQALDAARRERVGGRS
jgi:flagellar biosynthesis/type III secretory pathway protein FliH